MTVTPTATQIRRQLELLHIAEQHVAACMNTNAPMAVVRREANTALWECGIMRHECWRLMTKDPVAAAELLEMLENRMREVVIMARCCKVDAQVATHGAVHALGVAARLVNKARAEFGMSRIDAAYEAAADAYSIALLAPEAA